MKDHPGVKRMRLLAVLGPSNASADEESAAEDVGASAARAGWAVLTGGGPGVMAAASRGAVGADGVTVGVLPTAGPAGGYPNDWVQIPIYTGAGSARNAFNVLSADLCVAIGGGSGTLSEIALALKAGKPVWCLKSWDLTPPPQTQPTTPRIFNNSEELLSALQDYFASESQTFGSSGIR